MKKKSNLGNTLKETDITDFGRIGQPARFFLPICTFGAKGLKISPNFTIKVLRFDNDYFFFVGILAETGLIHHAQIVLIG